MPIVRSFIMLTNEEGRIFHENQEKDDARLLAAPPSTKIGHYKLLGLQVKNSRICGVITGAWNKATVIKYAPPCAVAFGGHSFTLGEDCTKKRTGHKDIDAFLDHINIELATEQRIMA